MKKNPMSEVHELMSLLEKQRHEFEERDRGSYVPEVKKVRRIARVIITHADTSVETKEVSLVEACRLKSEGLSIEVLP